MHWSVAIVQLCSTQDRDANLAAVDRFVRQAAAGGAEVVVLPEDATWLGHDRAAPVPMEPVDGPTVAALRRLACDSGVWLILGSFPEQGPGDGRHYNTTVVIDGTRDGGPVTATYRKLHLFDVALGGAVELRESAHIAPGAEVVCTEVAGVPTGLTICYDLRFPLLYQRLAVLGARAVTVPAAFTEYTGKDHWLPLLKARAIETQTFVIAPNQIGHHGGKRRSYGKSAIFDPWGVPLCVMPDHPGWALARLDLDHQDEIRRAMPCFEHRRIDVL